MTPAILFHPEPGKCCFASHECESQCQGIRNPKGPKPPPNHQPSKNSSKLLVMAEDGAGRGNCPTRGARADLAFSAFPAPWKPSDETSPHEKRKGRHKQKREWRSLCAGPRHVQLTGSESVNSLCARACGLWSSFVLHLDYVTLRKYL